MGISFSWGHSWFIIYTTGRWTTTTGRRGTSSNVTRWVKEVIIAPEDQVKSINTAKGAAIAIENEANDTVIVGKKADSNVVENTEVTQTYPVVNLSDDSDSDSLPRTVDADASEYMIVE